MIVYHADAKSTLKSSSFDWKLLGQRGPGALSYRVLSGNIGVVSDFENRQSRQFCMKTKMNVEKARREAMHMSWKVHDIERLSSLKLAITDLINRSFVRSFVLCFQNLLKNSIFFRISVDYTHFYTLFFNFLKVQNTQFWAKITGKAHVADPRIEHEPRRFFDAFWREIQTAKIQDFRFRSKTVRLLRYKEGDWT